MINSFFSKKHTVIFSWLISYMIILLIPVFIMGVVYFRTKTVIEHEIDKSNTFFLGKVQQGMDAILENVEQLSMRIALDQSVQSLLNLKYPFDDSRYYDIYNAAKDMKLFNESKSYVNNYYVYLKNLGMAITSGISYNDQLFYSEFNHSNLISYNQWAKMITGTYKGEYVLITSNNGENKGNGTIAYLRSIPFTSRGVTTANVIIKLDENMFINATKGFETVNQGTIVVLDENDNIINSGASDMHIDLKYADMQGETGLYSTKMDGKTVVVSYIASHITKWKYVSIIPASIFWEKEEYVRVLIFVCLIICVLIGIALSFLFTRRNYSPLKMLIGFFEDKSKYTPDSRYYEYKFIRDAINKTMEEKDSIFFKLKEQNKSLKNYFLEGLLKGREEVVPIHELLSTYDIKFETEDFIVLTFFIDDSLELFPEQDNMESIDDYKLLKFIVVNSFGELADQKNHAIMTEVDGILVCLLNLKENSSNDWKTEILRVTNASREFLSNYYKINLLISVSNVQKSLSGIPYAYKEAIQAMEYNRIMGINRVVFYGDIEEVSKVSYYYPPEKEYQIINCIKVGEFSGAKQLIEEIFQKNFQNNSVSVNTAKCMMFNMTNTIIKTANEISSVYGKDIIEELRPVEVFFGCKTINQMKTNMINILEKICTYIVKNGEHIDHRLRDKIMEYVEENYSRSDLGIAGIANHLQMNPNYISKIFKEQVGESLLDFINIYRLSKAKDLMKHNGITVEEAAGIVGYTNTRTFTRAFKRYEGITPGRFRGGKGIA